jgi:hypothetical protein
MEALPKRHDCVGWYGSHRHWRASNVIPIERYQSDAKQAAVLERLRHRCL